MTTSTPPTNPSPGRYWLDVANQTLDPHSMAGAALCGLLAIQVGRDEEQEHAEAANPADTSDYLELRREYDDLEAHLGKLQQVLDDVLAAVKPSTSKLADKVRSIVDEAFKVPDVAPPEPTIGDRVNDAATAGAERGAA